ncbi:TPA: site-2 protease family protein [archaeon]|nr:site-2 protease family protein [Candidatus Undinarchaeales archaeon SRR5007147.bin71]
MGNMQLLEKFTKKELQDLGISVIIMSAVVAVSMRIPMMFIFAILAIGPGFILHELGHKFMAQKKGYHAHYKMWKNGLIFAAFLSIFGWTFIAPGAVYFGGRVRHSDRNVGLVAVVGPMINVLLAVFFMTFMYTGNGFLVTLGWIGAYVNSFLAIFNLIPIYPLDGQKVFKWDWRIWAGAIGIAFWVFSGVKI